MTLKATRPSARSWANGAARELEGDGADDARAAELSAEAVEETNRGASHVKFGEDVAILAGDGLFAEAVRLACEQPGDPAHVLAALRELSAATSVDGQYVDGALIGGVAYEPLHPTGGMQT